MGEESGINQQRIPGSLFLFVLLGVVLGGYCAVHFNKSILFPVVFLATFATYPLWRKLVAANTSPPPVHSGLSSSPQACEPPFDVASGQSSPINRNPSSILAVALGTVFTGVGFVILLTYFKFFWLIALIGVACCVAFWKHRQANDMRAAVCFLSIFISIYGALGVLIVWLMH